ncbi:hypothetical protein [Rothia sp. CCM 9416]|uniref:preATP grasp domain-containing protein n=1 Tax=Rothia sp. CCM 9416 TaxID=3402655 RepID=UPI003AD884DE
MRLLIANDLDDSLLYKYDVRAWAHRIIWFAQNNDTIIMMDEPDYDYVEYVTRITGVELNTLKFLVLEGPGRFNRKMFDHHLLLDTSFIEKMKHVISDINITEVHALWNSPMISIFLEKINLEKLWKGNSLYKQNGSEFLNNMGNFRAISGGSKAPIAEGAVCKTIEDAKIFSKYYLEKYDALMIKKAHAGAGAGNILLSKKSAIDGSHSGNKQRVYLTDNYEEELFKFWDDKWEWVSHNGRYSVVVEEYIENAKSLYIEYFLDDFKCAFGEVGELHFKDGRLHHEVVPARNLNKKIESDILRSSEELAERYRILGCRGYLSVDSVIDSNDRFIFTEINAQFTGSSHLYGVISKNIARAKERGLLVTQLSTPENVYIKDFNHFIYAIKRSNLLYSEESKKYVLPVTPCIGKSGTMIVAVVHSLEEDPEKVLMGINY